MKKNPNFFFPCLDEVFVFGSDTQAADCLRNMLYEGEGEIFLNCLVRPDGEGVLLLRDGEGDLLGGDGDLFL